MRHRPQPAHDTCYAGTPSAVSCPKAIDNTRSRRGRAPRCLSAIPPGAADGRWRVTSSQTTSGADSKIWSAKRLLRPGLWSTRCGPWPIGLELRFFSPTLTILARLDLTEYRAEQVLGRLDDHRAELASALGRDPGLHVAALDYLSNVTGMISCPAIVEDAELERAKIEATTDPLTGLASRRRLGAAIDLEPRRSRRYGLQLALLLLEIDEFKSINDNRGHRVGDRVLERLGMDAHAVRPIDFSRTGALLELEAADLDPGPVLLRIDETAGDLRPISGRVVRIERNTVGSGTIRVGVAFEQPLDEDRLRRHVQRRGIARCGESGDGE